MNLKNFVRRQSPIMLAAAACVGVGLTVYSAIKASKKAEEVKDDLPEDVEILDEVKAVAPVYVETIILGGATIFCIAGSTILSKRQIINLTASYALLERQFFRYKDRVADIFGFAEAEDVEKTIIFDDMAEKEHPLPEEDEDLFFDVNSKRYFTDTEMHVELAEYKFKDYLITNGEAGLNTFYDILDHAEMPPLEKLDALGWNIYHCNTDWSSPSMEFDHEWITTDDGLKCCLIKTPIPPTVDYTFW